MARVDKQVADRVRAAVRAVLPPGVNVRVAGVDGAIIGLQIRKTMLKAGWIGEGELRHVRALLAQRGQHPNIAVARRLSQGARAALTEAGIGWVDESGAAELASGDLIVVRTGQPMLPKEVPPRWTPSVIGVVEALLCGAKATVSSVAEATGLSIGSCTGALKALTRLDLLSADLPRGRTSARRIVDADRLLDAYVAAAQSHSPPLSLRVGVTWRDVIKELSAVGRSWDDAGVVWAATAGAAAAVIAPLLTSVNSADVYVRANTVAELHAVATQSGLRPIEGGRLTLRPFPTNVTQRLSDSVHGLRVAPWPRIYADLHGAGVRGEEAAEHLKEVVRGR